MALSSGATGIILDQVSNLDMESLGITYTGKSMLFQALSPMNNMGWLIPILLIFMMVRDYTYGTIRNKIIFGYSRTQIYLASYLTTLLCGLGIMLLNMLISVGMGSLMYGYGEEFDLKVLSDLILIIVLGLLIYSVFLSIAHVSLQIFQTYGFIAYMVLLFGIMGLSLLNMVSADNKLIQIISDCNPINQISYISSPLLEKSMIFKIIINNILILLGLNAIGIYYLNKMDLK
jgi:ABC-type transport system involved in multi-copper enzyme maturation permease subunit